MKLYRDNEGPVFIISEADKKEIEHMKYLLSKHREMDRNTVWGKPPRSRIQWDIFACWLAVLASGVMSITFLLWAVTR